MHCAFAFLTCKDCYVLQIMKPAFLLCLRISFALLLLSMFAIFFGIPSLQRYIDGKTMFIEEKLEYSDEDAPGVLGKEEVL